MAKSTKMIFLLSTIIFIFIAANKMGYRNGYKTAKQNYENRGQCSAMEAEGNALEPIEKQK